MQIKKYLDLLSKKYGRTIRDNLLDSKNLILHSDSQVNNPSDQKKAVCDQISELASSLKRLNMYINDFDGQFCFDFPGWIGQLDFSKKSVKEIMILGIQPHIRECTYQICYNFYNLDNFLIMQRYSNKRHEDRLFNIMYSLFFNQNCGRKMDIPLFFTKLYITDLCHFALCGKASLIDKFKCWREIRNNTAETFLKDEINLINPKLIIAQGIPAMDFFKEKREKNICIGRLSSLPKHVIIDINEQNYHFLFLPHTSPRNKFWNDSENVKKLSEYIFKEFPNLAG